MGPIPNKYATSDKIMNKHIDLLERRTTADIVFDEVYAQIITLALLPGAKVSESEIAERFGVSRQPVRHAFNRLGNMGLLQIQPQRATLVRKFSLQAIAMARFVRLAMELELVRVAIDRWDNRFTLRFEKNLKKQDKAVLGNDAKAFHVLDESFHGLIAGVAGMPYAFDLILEHKAQVDRICVLSLKETQEMQELVNDHKKLLEGLANGDKRGVEICLREHLTRIDKTLETVTKRHKEYFVP